MFSFSTLLVQLLFSTTIVLLKNNTVWFKNGNKRKKNNNNNKRTGNDLSMICNHKFSNDSLCFITNAKPNALRTNWEKNNFYKSIISSNYLPHAIIEARTKNLVWLPFEKTFTNFWYKWNASIPIQANVVRMK